MKTRAHERLPASSRTTDADTGERKGREPQGARGSPVGTHPAMTLREALRARETETAREAVTIARHRADDPLSGLTPTALTTGLPRIPAEALARHDPMLARVTEGDGREDDTPPQKDERPDSEASSETDRRKTEPGRDGTAVETKKNADNAKERPTARGRRELGRVAAGSSVRVPGLLVLELPPTAPTRAAPRVGDRPNEDDEAADRREERLVSDLDRVERATTALEGTAGLEVEAARARRDGERAAPDAKAMEGVKTSSSETVGRTIGRRKEAGEVTAMEGMSVEVSSPENATAKAEPQSVAEVRAGITAGDEGSVGAAGPAAGPAAPTPGPAPELEQWQARAGAAVEGVEVPNLGSMEERTRGAGGYVADVVEAQHQQRDALPKQAQAVINARKRDISELDQVPEAIRQDDPVNAIEAIKAQAKREGLPKQRLPDLQPTPRGYLPNLFGDPITPSEVKELFKQYAIPVNDREPPGTTQLEALKTALANDEELKGRVAVFAGQELSGVDLPAKVEIAPIHQEDIAAVLARIVTEADQVGKTTIEEARKGAYKDTAMIKEDAFPTLGDDWASAEGDFLLGEMQRVADAAGIGKEKLDQAIRERQERLTDDVSATRQHGERVFKDHRSQLQAEFNTTRGTIEGLRQDWDAWADDRAARVKGNGDAKAVRARQGQLEQAVCDMANGWIVAYDDMGKQRASQLLQAMASQKKAYEAAIAKDRQDAIAAAGENETSRVEEETKKTALEWVKARMDAVNEVVEAKDGFLARNATTIADWQKRMRTTRDDELKQLRDWGDRQIGRERGWLDWIMNQASEWHRGQRSEAEAFAKQRSAETTASLGASLQQLNTFQTEFGDTLGQDGMAKREALSAEQQKVIDTFYAKDGGGDAIGAVAEGLKLRLRAQRMPELHNALRQAVRSTPPNSLEGMRLVALVKGMGEPDPVAIAEACRSGFEHTWGTEEQRIFAALARVKSQEGGQAVRAAYWTKYNHEDFDGRLQSELAGGALDNQEEYDKAKAQLEVNKIDMTAADLRIAVEEWGTDEAKINAVLRGLDADQRKAVVEAYERKYGESLRQRLDSELSDLEKEMTLALYEGNKDKADAIELKQSQTAFWGPDTEQMEKVYQRIADEEWERGRTEMVSAETIQQRIKARKLKVGEEYKEEFKTGIEEDFKKTFTMMGQPVYADLLIGLQASDEARVDAARLEIERNPAYSVYAEDKTINEKVLKAQYDRAYKSHLHDAEISLQKEEHDWIRLHPDKPWSTDYRRRRQQDLESKAGQAAQADAKTSMDNLRAHFMGTYGGGGGPQEFEDIIRDLTQGTGEEEAVERLNNGGHLSLEKELFYAIEAVDTDEERVKETLKGKTKEQIEAIRLAWNKAEPKRPDFDQCILAELSGRDHFDVSMMLKYGEPTNPDEAFKLAKEKLDYEGRTGGIQDTEEGSFKSERYRDLEQQVAQLEKDSKAYKEAETRYAQGKGKDEATGVEYIHPEMAAYQNSWMTTLAGFQDTVNIHRQEVDATADLLSSVVAMVVAVTAGALLAPFTAGQSLWLIAGAAALVAATSAAASIAVKYAIKGEAYGGDELTMDLLFAGVDMIVSAATAGVGGKLLKAGVQGGKTATEGAKKSFGQIFKEGLERAGTKEAKKQFTHTVLSETAEGMFSSVAVPAFMDEYGKGLNPLANMVLSMGLSMGSSVALAKGINGLSRLRPADFDFEAAARSSGNKAALVDIRRHPEKLTAMRSAYLEANPHKTSRDFLSDYDDLLLKQMKDGEVKAKWQHEARSDMMRYVPQDHKARFAETPIEMLSEQDFLKRTRSKKGEAFVEIKDGKPTVFVKQGASETALRREAPHLLQAVDEKWQAHLKDLDESNLRGWNSKDSREKFRLYDRKLAVEIDAARLDLELMRGQARRAGAPTGLAEEIMDVEDTLRNLMRRRQDIGDIGPLRRTLMAWGGSLLEPQYLKQEPRLFSKTSSQRYMQRFHGKVSINAEAELRPDFYPQRNIARGLDLSSEKLHFQVHKASGGSGPSATLLRAVDPSLPPGSPAPLVFIRTDKNVHFDLIDNSKLKLPPEPDGHFYRRGKSGEIELVPVSKHNGPFFELVDGAIHPRTTEAKPIVLSTSEVYAHAPRDWPVTPMTYDTLPRDSAGNIKPLPHGVVYEFPGGHRAWRLVNGGIAHESFVGVAHGRQHFELELETPGQVGRAGDHRAHTLGQGTGFESPFAIAYAPAKVNLAIQNDGIEEFLRGLRDQGPPGMRFHVVTETRFRPGSLDLGDITYRIEVSHGGRRMDFFEFDIAVSGPRHSPRIRYGIPSVTANPHLEPLFHMVDVPERLRERWAKITKRTGKAPPTPLPGHPAAPPALKRPAGPAGPSKAAKEQARKEALDQLRAIYQLWGRMDPKRWGLSDEGLEARLKAINNPVAALRDLQAGEVRSVRRSSPPPRSGPTEGPPPPSSPAAGKGGGEPRRRLSGATAEGAGDAYRLTIHPPQRTPEVNRSRRSAAVPEASARPEASGSPSRPAPPTAQRRIAPEADEAFARGTAGTGAAGRSPSAPEELGGAARRPEVEDPELSATHRLKPEASLGEGAELAQARGLPSDLVSSGTVLTRADFADLVPDKGLSQARRAKPAAPLDAEEARGVAGRRPTSNPEREWKEMKISHNLEVRADIRLLKEHLQALNAGRPKDSQWTVKDLLVNRAQEAAGPAGPVKASRFKRPDLQFTVVAPDGSTQRFHIEYDRSPPARSLSHARRILTNDPTSIVILKVIGHEGDRWN